MSGDYTKNTQGLRCYAATNDWGVVMPKYFTDLKNVGGGGGMPTNLWT